MRDPVPFVGLLLVTMVYGCSDSTEPSVVGVTLNAHQAVIYLGGERQFTATVQGSGGQTLGGVPVTWSTSDPTILTVSSDGLVTTLAVGLATVRAYAEGFVDSALITVSLVPVRTVTIVSSASSVGDTLQLVATVHDSNGTLLLGRSITWSSFDPSRAIVSPAGLLTSLRTGDVTVAATSEGVLATRPIAIGPGQYNQLGVGPGGESCGIIGNAGIAYCWGALPTTVTSAVPVPTLASHSFSSVHSSFYGACALADGNAFCWGSEFSNSFGSGQNHSDGYLVPEPAEVAGHYSFAELSVKLRLTCGVTVQHVGYCWGANSEGGIGNGDTSAVAPAILAGSLSWSSVSAAQAGHSCGITTAGLAYCWGTNHYGELGTGDTLPSLYPVPVAGGLLFKSISVGNYFTCAITTADQAYCWGNRGIDGTAPEQLGSTVPYEFCDANMIYACNKSPVPVAGGLAFVSLGTGQGFSCGLTTSGVVFCWGSNQFGQLGLSSPPDQCGSLNYGLYACSRTPQPINSSLRFSSISVGTAHICGISAGTAYCWGQSVAGELGDPSLPFDSFSATPVRVVDP